MDLKGALLYQNLIFIHIYISNLSLLMYIFIHDFCVSDEESEDCLRKIIFTFLYLGVAIQME
jgi:hypothetical protein